jgi:FkbM family methyltransferase
MTKDDYITVDKIRKRIVSKLEELDIGSLDVSPERRGQGVSKKEKKIERLIMRIPILSNLARWGYRLIALPWRVERLGQKTDVLITYLVGLHQKTDELHRTTNELHRTTAALYQERDELRRTIDGVIKKVDFVTEIAELTNKRVCAIKPVITAGDNIIVTRVDEFIMGFPAEEWRLAAYHVFHGQLERGLVQVFRTYVKKEMVVVDIGANVGTYTLIAATLVGDGGKVYSFEPTPRTYAILHDNVQINGLLESGRVVFSQIAVTDKKGKAQFAVYDRNCGHNTLFPNRDDRGLIEVDTDSLDDILIDVARVDVVKIDAEGAEPFVMRGMKSIISQNPNVTIFMEFAPIHLRRAAVDAKEFIKEIQGYGFSIQKIVEPSGDISPIGEQELLDSYSVNIMLTKCEEIRHLTQ